MKDQKSPAVTVLMPVYNGEKYLRQALESILTQTFPDFEFLIIDDGSTDRSLEIIRSYHDPRIRLIVHAKNKKLIPTLNEGIAKARAPLIARMDSDDVSMPERLARQLTALQQHPEVVLIGGDFQIVNAQGNLVVYEPAFPDDASIRLSLGLMNPFAHGLVMYRKEAVQKVGGYSHTAYLVEDYDLWVRLGRVGKYANIPKLLFQWRLNPGGESISHSQKQNAAAQNIAKKVWRSFGPAGPPKRLIEESIRAARSGGSLRHRRRIADLHIRIAKHYLFGGKRSKIARHVVAALRIDPRFYQLYFYVPMIVLPARFFPLYEEQSRWAAYLFFEAAHLCIATIKGLAKSMRLRVQ